MEHSTVFFLSQCHHNPTSPVHDMNFLKTNWGTCFLISFMVWGDDDTKTLISLFCTSSTSCNLKYSFSLCYSKSSLSFFIVCLSAQCNFERFTSLMKISLYILHYNSVTSHMCSCIKKETKCPDLSSLVHCSFSVSTLQIKIQLLINFLNFEPDLQRGNLPKYP